MLDRLVEDDGIRGDEYGDFDKQVVEEERARLKRTKVGAGSVSSRRCSAQSFTGSMLSSTGRLAA